MESTNEKCSFMNECVIHILCFTTAVLEHGFKFELSLLSFIRAIRTSNLHLYVESLTTLVPWFFALDHVHYARWLSVHIRDMRNLSLMCPDVYEHFKHGSFNSNTTRNSFSSIGLDQGHEHRNARGKGDGRTIGLTENPGALQRLMVAGPQISAISRI